MVTRSPRESDLGDALRRLYEPGAAVPPDVDDAMRRAFAEHFAAPRPLARFRWARPAAAAAIVLVGLAVWAVVPRSAPHAGAPLATLDRADLDANGKVDILDAFDLARGIESGRRLDLALHDVNGDGVVDFRDVDMIAHRAVSLDVHLEGGVGG
ncbi:MAG: dockerin type I domain-containing protein [Planctomycetota bacterium]|jgi:hypothetical protein